MTESDINKLTLIIQGWLVFMFLMAVPIFLVHMMHHMGFRYRAEYF